MHGTLPPLLHKLHVMVLE